MVVAIFARPHHVLFIRDAALARRRLRCNSLKSAKAKEGNTR